MMTAGEGNPENASRASRRIAGVCVAVVAGMLGLSYASVPLYSMFCQLTGFGGTPNRAYAGPDHVLPRQVNVRFDASVARDLDWRFAPEQASQKLQVGEVGLAFYKAKNLSNKTISGTATFNVMPAKAGVYFSKIECFCFTEQQLAAGQEIDMPVQYFIDPAIDEDENMRDVKTITLSYTFYPTHPRIAGSTSPTQRN